MADYYNTPKSGLMSVGAYQVAGLPFVTSSVLAANTELNIAFPKVTKSLTVYGTSGSIRVHFAPKATAYTNGNYITVLSGTTQRYELKCQNVYVSISGSNTGAFELLAELTSIDRCPEMILTGSGIG